MSSSRTSAGAEKAELQQHYDAAASRPTPPISPAPAGKQFPSVDVEHDSHEGGSARDDPNRVPTPPPYSGPSSSSQVNLVQRPAPRGPQGYPGLPKLDYRLYSPPLFTLSDDQTTIRSTAPYLSASASALADLVRAQATLPPKPQIHITGRRSSGSGTDFAIKLNLMPLLVPEDARARMDYLRCVGEGEPALRGGFAPAAEPHEGDGGLDAWARRFVADQGAVKSFALDRVVANMDVGWLEGQIRSMVASTGYKGLVTVTFPVTHARVVVQNPDKVNRFFTSVTTLFAGKRKYEVVKAVWPFATAPSGEHGRRCAVQSEETWWKEWRDPIRYAIATKRHGWVTNEDKLCFIMEGLGRGLTSIDWGPDY